MKYAIWTRYTAKRNTTWIKMLGNFDSAWVAMNWLHTTYSKEAGFWDKLEVRIIEEKK